MMISIGDIYSGNGEYGLYDLTVGELKNVIGGIGEAVYPRSRYYDDPIDINDISNFLKRIDVQLDNWRLELDKNTNSFQNVLTV